MTKTDKIASHSMVPATLLLAPTKARSRGLGFAVAFPVLLGVHVVLCCLDGQASGRSRRRSRAK
jgi:hypothetical protein